MSKAILSIMLVVFLSSGSVNASLISPTGSINGLDLSWGQSESDSLQAFNENQGVNVRSDAVYVDYLVGVNLTEGHPRGRSHRGLTLDEGRYNSHLIHFDPVGVTKGEIENLRVSFTENIVAIIVRGRYLNMSDNIFGSTDAVYQNKNSRRLESHDIFTLENSNTLLFNKLRVGKYWTDEARIITYFIPEPSSFALFGLGLMGIVGLSVRRLK